MNLTRRALLTAAAAPYLASAAPRAEASVPNGLWPVMLTPFREDKSIDWRALDALTDWYIQNGADGLFACCRSSEVDELTESERLEVASRVAKRAGKIPVVAGGLPGRNAQPVAEFSKKLIHAGVRAAIATTCQLAEEPENDATWRERMEAILDASGRLPFGLYEAPKPYKRLLTPEMMSWAAKTGRFVFLKDTACEIGAIEAKCKAAAGSPLGLFNAHVPLLIEAIQKGAAGFSGVAANAYPHLVSYATHQHAAQPSRAAVVQEFLTTNEKIISFRYPLSAKAMAAMAGIPIQPVCRRPVGPLDADAMERLKKLRKAADSLLA